MKKLHKIFTLLGLMASVEVLACGDYPVISSRKADGSEIGLYIDNDLVRNTPKWVLGQGEPPLSVAEVSSVAIDWANSRWPKFDQVNVDEITVTGYDCFQDIGYSYYRIKFTPIFDGNKIYGSTYMVAILMDGTIIEPRKVER